MIRVTVEIVPFGIEGAKRTLGWMEICNTGGTSKRGRYSVVVDNKGERYRAEIPGYLRGRGFWNLVKKALNMIKFE